MVALVRDAGRIGVQPPHPMRQPLFDQEIQRAIGDGRLAAEAFGRKHAEVSEAMLRAESLWMEALERLEAAERA